MVGAKTTLILGAGASVDYGFPTGLGLRALICEQLKYVPGQSELLPRQLMVACGANTELIEDFRSAFERSGLTSIDSFLAKRPEYADIGKLAIASILVPIEQESMLHYVNKISGNGGWYQMLWARLWDACNNPEDLLKTLLSIVTFNYDRSLEVFLLLAISETFKLNRQDAYDVLSRLRIHHVYGTLGEYDLDLGYRYGDHNQEEQYEAIKRAAHSIKTIPSERIDVDMKAQDYFNESKQIYFFGFGFDRQNCQRIGLTNFFADYVNQYGVNIYASAFALTKDEKDVALLNAELRGKANIGWTDGNCENLFRSRLVNFY